MCLIFLLLFCSNSFASEPVIEYKDAAGMGRGNVTTSFSNNNVSKVFYNPSLLAESTSFSFELLNPTLDISLNNLKLLSQPPSFNSGTTYETFTPYFGSSYSAQAFASPVVSFKGFSIIPIFSSGLGSMTIRDPVFAHANGLFYYEYGTAVGKGFRINDSFSLGLSARYIRRTAIIEEVGIINLLKPTQTTKIEGNTIAFNFGINYKIKNDYKTNIAFNWRNIGSPSFWKNTNSTIDESKISKLPEEFDLGFSSSFFPVPYFSKKVDWSLEFHNINDDSYDLLSKLSLGLQYNVFSWFNLKAGLYEKQITFGTGLKSKIFSIDLSSYGEDFRQGSDIQIRHLIIGLKLGYNF